jgi:hypothetical protein
VRCSGHAVTPAKQDSDLDVTGELPRLGYEMPTGEHTHGFTGWRDLVTLCRAQDCGQYPRQINVRVSDQQQSSSHQEVCSETDLIAVELLEVRNVLALLAALNPADVPFHRTVVRAHASAVDAVDRLMRRLEDQPR